VRPFVLQSGDQFRVPPPPTLDSADYAAAFDEVKRLGGDGVVTSTERTEDGLPGAFVVRLWAAAALAAAAAWGLELLLGVGHPIGLGLLATGLYGVVYFAAAAGLGVREGRLVLARIPGIGCRSPRIGSKPVSGRRRDT
jgi:hypothetical protein